MFEILISEDYPFKFGKFFKTKIFHPNINRKNGLVSLDILGAEWSPALTFEKAILEVQSLLDDPNSDDFLNEKAARLYRENRVKYKKVVKKFTTKFANFVIFENELSKYNFKIEHIEK